MELTGASVVNASEMENEARLRSNREVIRKGSKTFSWASLFFQEAQRRGAWNLYSWCRHVDDEIDEVADVSLLETKLVEVKQKTQSALSGQPQTDLAYDSLRSLKQEFSIDSRLPLDLIRGMEFDSKALRPKDEAELEDYCYCVAGTVGLMMCSVMGVKSEKAYLHARSLGEAMQLTNICRDLWEDHNKNRNYLPQTWLRANSVSEQDLWKYESTPRLLEFRSRLLKRAEEKYNHAFEGLKYLNFRCALAVVLAGFIYREIGRKALSLNAKSLKVRTVIGPGQKIIVSLRAFGYLIYKRFSESI